MNSSSSLNKYAPRADDWSESTPWRVVKHSEGLAYVATLMGSEEENRPREDLKKDPYTFAYLRLRLNLGMTDASLPFKNKVKRFFKVLKSYEGLTHLDLATCQITDHSCREYIGPMLAENTTLVDLELKGNAFTDLGAEVLFSSLIPSQCKIAKLKFSGNPMSAESIKSLQKLLINSAEDRFTDIDLSWTDVGAQGIKLLVPGMFAQKKLKSLNLESSKLGDEGAIELANYFDKPDMATIEKLVLSLNHIGRVGVKALCTKFRPDTYDNMKDLNLSKNYFGDEGFEYIRDMMKPNIKMKTLKLNKTGITQKAFEKFCMMMIVRYDQAYGPYPDLNHLEVGNNGLGNLMTSLFGMLKRKNCVIQTLAYDGNEVTNFGAKLFQAFLKTDFKRRSSDEKFKEPKDVTDPQIIAQMKIDHERRNEFLKLSLKSNLFDGDGCEYLADLVNANEYFNELDLRKNKVGVKGAIWFKKQFRKFQTEAAKRVDHKKVFKFHILPKDVTKEGVNHLAIGIREHPETVRAWMKEVGKKDVYKLHAYTPHKDLDSLWDFAIKERKARVQRKEKIEQKLEEGINDEDDEIEEIDNAENFVKSIESKEEEYLNGEVPITKCNEKEMFARLGRRAQLSREAMRHHRSKLDSPFREFDTPALKTANYDDKFKMKILLEGLNDEKEDELSCVKKSTYQMVYIKETDRGVVTWDGDLWKKVKSGLGCVLGNTLYRYSLMLRMKYEAENPKFIRDLYLMRHKNRSLINSIKSIVYGFNITGEWKDDDEERKMYHNMINSLVEEDLKNFWDEIIYQTSEKYDNLTMFEFAVKHCEKPVIDTVRQFLNIFPATLLRNSPRPTFLQQTLGHDNRTFRDICLESKEYNVVRYAKAKKLIFFRFLEVEPVYISKFITVSKVEDLLLTEEYEEKDRFFYMRRIAPSCAAKENKLFENEFNAHASFMDSDLKYLDGDVPTLDKVKNIIMKSENATLDASFAPQIAQLFNRKQMLTDDMLVPIFTKMHKTNLREVLDNESLAGGRDLNRARILLKMVASSLQHFNDRKWAKDVYKNAPEVTTTPRIHGSVKPRNIVLRIDDELPNLDKGVGYLPGKWVLTDFSRSTKHGDDFYADKHSAYNPPEVAKRLISKADKHLKERTTASQKIDVWQFGCVLFEVLSGTSLFKMEGNNDYIVDPSERGELVNWLCLDEKRCEMILAQLRSNKLARYKGSLSMTLNNFGSMSDEEIEETIKQGTELAKWCLQGRPEDRPSFEEIIAHPFLNAVDTGRTKNETKQGKCNAMPTTEFENKRFLDSQPHVHVVNTEFEQAGVVLRSLENALRKCGCRVTTDAMPSSSVEEYETTLRKNVESARVVACILTSDAFYKPKVVKQLLFAEDYRRKDQKVHGRILFIDVSAGVNLAKDGLDWDKKSFSKNYIVSDKFQYLLKAISEENPDLSKFSVPKSENDDKFDAWKNVLSKEFASMILSYVQDPIKFQPHPFLASPMADRILEEGHLVPTRLVSGFSGKSLGAKNFKDSKDILNKKLKERKQKFMNLYFLPANRKRKGPVRTYVLCAKRSDIETRNAVNEIVKALETPSPLNQVAKDDKHKDPLNPKNRLFNRVKTSYNIKKDSHLKVGGRIGTMKKLKDNVMNVSREDADLLIILYCTPGVFQRYKSFLHEACEKRPGDFSLLLVGGFGFKLDDAMKEEIKANVPEALWPVCMNKDFYVPYFKPKKDPWQYEAAMRGLVAAAAHKVTRQVPRETF